MAKGKWAQGIVPRNFRWVVKDQIAVSERPGGYGENHRRVRREEEIIWINRNEFTCVFSLITSPHNLHNYDEHEVPYSHRPYPTQDDPGPFMKSFYEDLLETTTRGGKVLIHRDELGDTVCGLMAGYLIWAELIPSGPKAISLSERLFERQLGPTAREVVATAVQLRDAK